MPEQDYSQYTLSDFLEDQNFVRWVTKADSETDAWWQAFMARYPEKRTIMLQASAIIKTYRKQELFTNDSRKQDVWARINDTIQQDQSARRQDASISLYLKVAASITVLILCSAVLWFSLRSGNTVNTASNEITTITLPD